MKKNCLSLTLALVYVVPAVAQTPTTQPTAAPAAAGDYTVTERGPHHRVWSRVTWWTNALQRPVAITNCYTELQTGLHRWQNNQWIESVPVITPVAGGAVTTQCQHQVTFAANLNSLGAITLTAPDGKILSSHVLGLSYFDTSSGQAVLLATTQDSLGGLVGQNQVVYTNAFNGAAADVQYVLSKAGLEQNVILRVAPASPQTFGLNPATTRLQVLTEFYNPPAPAQTASAAPDGTADATLDFGAMQIGRGQAFLAGTAGATNGGIAVAKQWAVIGGRTFLVESVPYVRVTAQLAGLAADQSVNPLPPLTGEGPDVLAALGDCLPEAPDAEKKGSGLLAQAAPSVDAGFVIDYSVLTSGANKTLQGDTTYYVNGFVNLTGTTTIEGGTVVKFSTNSDVKLAVSTPGLVCQTGPYRPAVFTSKNDNSVGETISGSSGNPATGDATYLEIHGDGSSNQPVRCMRFLFAGTAISQTEFYHSLSPVWHCQFVKCGVVFKSYPYYLPANDLELHNVLITQCGLCFQVTGSGIAQSLRGEHLTADQVSFILMASGCNGSSVWLTNSILTDYGQILYPAGCGSENLETCYHGSSATMYETTGNGAGNYYLANVNYRQKGNPNISAALRDELKQKTTCRPTELGAVFTSDIVLGAGSYPLARRDTGSSPDYGYHYDPLDYVVSGKSVSARLTLVGGVVVGTYGPSSGYGLSMLSGSSLISAGSPSRLNRIVRYNTVQEQPSSSWSSSTVAPSIRAAYNAASVQLHFTAFSLLGSVGYHLYGTAAPTLGFKHCQFAGGRFLTGLTSLGLTNCLWEMVSSYVFDYSGSAPYFMYNNLVRGGSCEWEVYFNGWIVRDNSFDSCRLTETGYSVANDYNAYIGVSPLSSSRGHDQTMTSANYDTGPFGRYYYTGAMLTALHDAGSRNAAEADLGAFTVQVDQTPDAGKVDIGFHYMATNAVFVTGNNAGDQTKPSYIQTYDFATGDLVNFFIPNGAGSANNGRGLAVHSGQIFYTELMAGRPPGNPLSDGVHVAPYGTRGSGGDDFQSTPSSPNPRPNPRHDANGNPVAAIQDLAFQGDNLFLLTGYSDPDVITIPLWVYKLDPNNGSVLSGPIEITGPYGPYSDADGFTVLPNGSFLINDGDGSRGFTEYREYSGTSGTYVSGGLLIDLRSFSLAQGRGVATAPDGKSLFFFGSHEYLADDGDTIIQTDLAGRLIGYQTISPARIEDIDVVAPQ